MPLINPATGRPFASSLAELDERSLVAAAAEEMRAQMAAGAPLVLELDAVQAMQLASLIQLALRHPDVRVIAADPASVGESVVDAIRLFFDTEACPHATELLRRGDDPACDQSAAGLDR